MADRSRHLSHESVCRGLVVVLGFVERLCKRRERGRVRLYDAALYPADGGAGDTARSSTKGLA